MFPIFLIIFFSAILAFALDVKITRIIAPLTYTLLLILYGLAIIGKVHYGFIVSCIMFAGIWIFYLCRKKRIFPTLQSLISSESAFSIGFAVYLVVLGIVFFCYRNHFVFNWDDFHYNALFPKDMYYYKTMPTGWMNASEYKDYKPLMQLFFFWGFKGFGDFSEPLMFSYKMFLIYTALLPMFELIDRVSSKESIISQKSLAKYVRAAKMTAIGIITFILPFAFLFEVTISLSMDAYMASIFAYLVIMCVYEKRRDYITYYSIFTALLSLALVKSIALMFVGIVLGVWFLTGLTDLKKSENKKQRILIFTICAASSAAAYLSWTVFCKIKGNSTYLSDSLMDNIKGGITWPAYTHDTVTSFLKSIFTLNLNLGSCGLPFFGVIVACLVLVIFTCKNKKFDKKDALGWGVLVAGMAVYVMFLLYTYLFIFYDWEAESLSSLDRYFGTYALVIMIVAIYMLVTKCEDTMLLPLIITGILLIATMNYHSLGCVLSSGAYEKEYGQARSQAQMAADELKEACPTDYDMGVVLTVGDSENDMYSRSLDYDMVPLVSKPFNVTAHENVIDDIYEYIDTFDVRYVYFTRQLEDDLGLSQYDELLEEGHAESVCFYEYDKETCLLKEASKKSSAQ